MELPPVGEEGRGGGGSNRLIRFISPSPQR